MKVIVISAIWCPSCLVMRPRFEQVKKQFNEIEFVTYDIDLDEEAKLYNAGHILPVFILLNDENIELGRLTGEQKQESLINLVEKNLQNI